MSPTLIIGAVLTAALLALGVYAWDADKALVRDRKLLVAAELQRDQFAAAVRQKDEQIKERNQTLSHFVALPEVRNRLCAVQGATSGCCQPTGECKP